MHFFTFHLSTSYLLGLAVCICVKMVGLKIKERGKELGMIKLKKNLSDFLMKPTQKDIYVSNRPGQKLMTK